MKGKISEIFDSIQGEGIYLGERQLFIRFYGCNLRCKYCDTRQESYLEYSPGELLDEIKLYEEKFHSLSFTGGEPLVQVDFLKEVLAVTQSQHYKNYLETNGTLPGALAQVIDYVDIVAMDIKLPSSTGCGVYWDAHRAFLKIASLKEVFVKVVVCASTLEAEYLEALELVREISRQTVLVLQPNSEDNILPQDERLLRFKELAAKEHIAVCVIPQLHKIVGVR